MANPRSVTIMTGWLASDVRFVSDKYGKEFQARFVLKVQRSYKNKEGHYESDFFQARLNGSEGRINLARKLKPGDAINVTGDFRNEKYEMNGKQYYVTFLNIDSFTWTPLNSLNKEDIIEIHDKKNNTMQPLIQKPEPDPQGEMNNEEADTPYLDANSIRALCQELPFQ